MSPPGEPSRWTFALLRPGGGELIAIKLHPLWAFVLGLLLVALLAAQAIAAATYVRTLEKIRSYSALMVEVTELRRQNASLLELDGELRDLLGRQQQMLRLAGIETALRPDLDAGDNSGGLGPPGPGGDATGFHVPALGATTRDFDMNHLGVDFGLARKRAVSAAASGAVIESGQDDVLGLRLVVQHNDSVLTVYANNERNLVAVGDTVLAGEVIALVGSGFEGKEPHLHFEVWIHGEPVHPGSVLPEFMNP